ncbi:MAG: ubiquinone/menaquinone biosynthesis C-methylase UbiE [Myxococcota bacterium]|jgi:ubiquinone/menaquinone biosynthesis C-methylase UbiE
MRSMKAPLTQIIQHFDGLAPDAVDFADNAFGVWDRDLHQQVLQYAELDHDAVLVELGCGTGRFAHLLAPHVKRTIAIDCAPNMLRTARQRQPPAPNTAWVPGDIRDLPPTPDVDTVVMCHTLRYLDADERAALFSELYGRLPVGGLLIIGDLLWSMAPDMIEGAEGWLDERWAHTLMANAVEKELRAAGFDTFVKRMHPALSVVRAARMPTLRQ